MEKNIVEIMKNRRSNRSFTSEKVNLDDVYEVLKLAQRSQNSMNAQQTSVIITTDKKKIEEFGEISWNQKQVKTADIFLTIVIDFNRTKYCGEQENKPQVIQGYEEGLLVGAVDAGIYLQSIQLLLSAYGYGSTAIGGIRNDPARMIEILELPKYTYPIVGCTIGIIDTNKIAPLRPRVKFDSFVHYNVYNDELVKQGVLEYDQELKTWWKNVMKMENKDSYIESVGNFYASNYAEKVGPTLKMQGFLNSK